MAWSTSESSAIGWSPTACRSTARSVSVCERLSTNPARCAASWTLSVKTSAFFSRGVQRLVAEQGGQRDRQQRGDRAAEEPDAVLLLARRAGVVPGVVVGVRPGLGEHRQDPAVPVVRVVLGRGRRQQHPLADREPAQPLDGRGVRGRPVPPSRCRQRVLGLSGRVEQRPEPALVGGVVPPDRGVVAVERWPRPAASPTPQPDRPQCRQ